MSVRPGLGEKTKTWPLAAASESIKQRQPRLVEGEKRKKMSQQCAKMCRQQKKKKCGQKMGLNSKDAKHTTSEAGRQQERRRQKNAPAREDPAPWRPRVENEHLSMACKGESKISHTQNERVDTAKGLGGQRKRKERTLSVSGTGRREQPLRATSQI